MDTTRVVVEGGALVACFVGSDNLRALRTFLGYEVRAVVATGP